MELEVKDGLIFICCQCKRFRLDNGEYVCLGDLPLDQQKLVMDSCNDMSHTYCNKCASIVRKELADYKKNRQ